MLVRSKCYAPRPGVGLGLAQRYNGAVRIYIRKFTHYSQTTLRRVARAGKSHPQKAHTSLTPSATTFSPGKSTTKELPLAVSLGLSGRTRQTTFILQLSPLDIPPPAAEPSRAANHVYPGALALPPCRREERCGVACSVCSYAAPPGQATAGTSEQLRFPSRVSISPRFILFDAIYHVTIISALARSALPLG